VPPNIARSVSLRIPFSPTLIALFAPEAEMKRSREHARRWALRELDRRLYQRGPAAMETKTDPNAAVNLEAAAATQQQGFAA
jgi:hypothetical protein